jgi:putative phosphoribosyl transferase
VAPADVVDHISEADEVVCLSTPRSFWAVGAHYRSFSATTDDEVVALLDRAQHEWGGPHEAVVEEDVTIPVDGIGVEGHLHVPAGARGVVVFAHGSGSSRHSPRNRYVARVLQEAGLGTLLMDLLSSAEERERSTVFDIPLLAGRLIAATEWLRGRTDTASCRIGYFGASTGAAAALWAAAEPGSPVAAVVSRGGRPDLAGARLGLVRAPTLLVVGGNDLAVLDLNRRARAQLVNCPSELVVVDGATHLFEEPGTLAEAAAAARDWFVQHLGWRADHAATG